MKKCKKKMTDIEIIEVSEEEYMKLLIEAAKSYLPIRCAKFHREGKIKDIP